MTCFWNGILDGLNFDVIKNSLPNCLKNPNGTVNKDPLNLVKYLKENNKITENVLIQNEELRKQEKEENYEHIQSFDKVSIHQGYFCSTSDPFLILICELLNINIEHRYCGVNIKYTNKQKSICTLYLGSDRGHLHHMRTI